MDMETYTKLKKYDEKTVTRLMDTYLQKAWFLSCHLTGDTEKAAPLLVSAWSDCIDEIMNSYEPLKESFRSMLHQSLLTLFVLEDYTMREEDVDDFASLPEPEVAKQYQIFADELDTLPVSLRAVYLFHTLGSLSVNQLSEIFETTPAEINGTHKRAEEQISEYRNSISGKKGDWIARVRLFAEFKSPSDAAFREVEVPPAVRKAVSHTMDKPPKKVLKQKEKEEKRQLAQLKKEEKAAAKAEKKLKSQRKKAAKKQKKAAKNQPIQHHKKSKK